MAKVLTSFPEKHFKRKQKPQRAWIWHWLFTLNYVECCVIGTLHVFVNQEKKQLKAERLLHILTINQYFYSFNKSHRSLRVQVQDRRIWNLWKLQPFQRSVIRVPRMKTSLTLKKMTVMMMMTEVSFNTTIWQIFSTHILNFLGHVKAIAGKKNRENVRGNFLLFFTF